MRNVCFVARADVGVSEALKKDGLFYMDTYTTPTPYLCGLLYDCNACLHCISSCSA